MQEQCTPAGLHKLRPIQKAARLIAADRVRLAPFAQVYDVHGDHGSYRVIAAPEGIFCPCQASTPLCAHVLAVAQVRQSDRALSADLPALTAVKGEVA